MHIWCWMVQQQCRKLRCVCVCGVCVYVCVCASVRVCACVWVWMRKASLASPCPPWAVASQGKLKVNRQSLCVCVCVCACACVCLNTESTTQLKHPPDGAVSTWASQSFKLLPTRLLLLRLHFLPCDRCQFNNSDQWRLMTLTWIHHISAHHQ